MNFHGLIQKDGSPRLLVHTCVGETDRKIQDLPGWPPSEFQCADKPDVPFEPEDSEGLRIDSAAYIPGDDGAGYIVLTLIDTVKAIECSARLKVAEPAVARRALRALVKCKGLTLAQAGLRKFHQ